MGRTEQMSTLREVYSKKVATGAPVSFGDRATVEAILDQCADNDYGVRSLIHALIQSELFLHK